jgi:hypothetical protein
MISIHQMYKTDGSRNSSSMVEQILIKSTAFWRAWPRRTKAKIAIRPNTGTTIKVFRSR